MASAEGRRTEYLPLAGLEADPRNPKAHDLDTIDASVGRFGIIDPIVRDDRTGRLISGHGRAATLRAMHDRGETPPDGVHVDGDGGWLVPVTVGWASRSDTEAHAALIALNRTTELGGWVDDELLGLLDELAEQGDEALSGVGFGADEINDLRGMLAGLEEEEPEGKAVKRLWNNRLFKEKPASGDVSEGDIYRLGDHLLVCGRGDDPALWDRVLGTEQVSMVFTDPPYGIDYSGGSYTERERIQGDTPDEAPRLFSGALDALTAHVVPGAVLYATLPSGGSLPAMLNILNDRNLHRWMLIWLKHQATFGRSDYHQKHEMIAYGWWPGGHHEVEDRTQTTVWEIDRPRTSQWHPTAKPIELVERAMNNSTYPAELVADPFAGSFSVVEAAHLTGRVAVGVEIEPGYVAEALSRLSETLGETPVLLEE